MRYDSIIPLSKSKAMGTYVVLGGTGATGSRIIGQLLQEEDIHLKVYARSQSKLEEKIPTLTTSPRAKIFIGSITNIDLLASCLDGADTVFTTVGINAYEPKRFVVQ
ncbi:hypothetical protein BBP40_002556 [Aspergillus hancockii]|nr:hypothetical protein BBP40_002556 [Aspergillus hancockii]